MPSIVAPPPPPSRFARRSLPLDIPAPKNWRDQNKATSTKALDEEIIVSRANRIMVTYNLTLERWTETVAAWTGRSKVRLNEESEDG